MTHGSLRYTHSFDAYVEMIGMAAAAGMGLAELDIVLPLSRSVYPSGLLGLPAGGASWALGLAKTA